MGSGILNISTRGVELHICMGLLGLYDVQRIKAVLVAVSLGIEQIISPPAILLPVLTFCLNPSVHWSFCRTCWPNGV